MKILFIILWNYIIKKKEFFNKISIEGHDPDFKDRDLSDFEKYIHYFNINTKPNLIKYFYYKKAMSNNIFLSKEGDVYHKYLLTNATEFKYGKIRTQSRDNILKTGYEFGMLQDKIYPHEHDIIKNYLEGCQFIFDLYFNNTINNYRWYYKYEEAPTLTNLALFFYKKDISVLIPLFNISPDVHSVKAVSEGAAAAQTSPNVYMTSEQYQKYSNHNKNEILHLLTFKMPIFFIFYCSFILLSILHFLIKFILCLSVSLCFFIIISKNVPKSQLSQ